MAQVSAASTPSSKVAIAVAAETQPGTWTHPRLDEIQRRLNASTLSRKNIGEAAVHIFFVFLSFLIPAYTPSTSSFVTLFRGDYGILILYIARLYLISRILYIFSPLLRPKDDLSDIPLTPTQRALLGLGPSFKPTTPGSTFATPPRYSRSVTPRSDSRSQSASPFAGSPSTGVNIGAGSTSYSPSASPLFQKAIGRDITRRLSYGSPSPLAQSRNITLNDSSSSFVPSTPSPTANKGGPSVMLNSRWLYEKDRSSPSIRGVYS